MKIDRSQESALEVVKSNAKDSTTDPAEQNLSENLLKIGFENQFQKNETSRIKNLIDDLIDEYLINKD
jgi:hypothetical protein